MPLITRIFTQKLHSVEQYPLLHLQDSQRPCYLISSKQAPYAPDGKRLEEMFSPDFGYRPIQQKTNSLTFKVSLVLNLIL